MGEVTSDTIVADEPRKHLRERKIGNGRFGFSFRLPTDATFTGDELVQIISASDEMEIVSRRLKDLVSLSVAHAEVVAAQPEPTAAQPANQATASEIEEMGDRAEFVGWLGTFASRRISGWISSKSRPNEPQQIIIRVGDHKSPPILANEERQHLESSGRPVTSLGFSYTLPNSLPIRREDIVEVLQVDGAPTGVELQLDKANDRFFDISKPSSIRSKFPRAKQEDAVLLWCPISVSGLTTQLEQVTEILRAEKIRYYISYHIAPSIDHPEVANWVNPKDIDSPKVVFYFERFAAFDRGFDSAFKIFYVNLDWLSDGFIGLARTYADIILAPVTFRQDYLERLFPNQKVLHLPWPSSIEPDDDNLNARAPAQDGKINVLYVGNDYAENSRKSPFPVVEAILAYQGDNIEFHLKFRTPLPADVREKLEACSRVKTIIDAPTDRSVISSLHLQADVALIPNECEGNGLSLLEAWAFGVIPAVLRGHPMTDSADDESAFFIDCEQYGWREKTPVYRTTSQQVLEFFQRIDHSEINKRQSGIAQKIAELQARKIALKMAVRELMHVGGIRNKKVRLQVEAAHLLDDGTGQSKAQKLLFGNSQHRQFVRTARLVDVIMTTSQRPDHLRRSLPALIKAMELSPFRHRFFVAIDGLDEETSAMLNQFKSAIDVVLYTKSRAGLPFAWNSIRTLNENLTVRTEEAADYLCYIQDDCLINDPSEYFSAMVDMASAASPAFLGLVSGFHTDVHPGFATGRYLGYDVIFSDSIDGKNFMGRPSTFRRISPLTWWFSDGMRRGNPGPIRGSHFDLWLWKESPNSLAVQQRINVIIPKLTSHIASDPTESTWNNDTSDANTQARKEAGRIYITRK